MQRGSIGEMIQKGERARMDVLIETAESSVFNLLKYWSFEKLYLQLVNA